MKTRFQVSSRGENYGVFDNATGAFEATPTLEAAYARAKTENNMDATPEVTETNPPGCSASIAQLAAALAKAQGAMKAASKDAVNPHFKSKYATLASVLDACRAQLAANGLSHMQRVRTGPEGVTVLTMLMHSSGEWVLDEATWPVAQRTPQAIGSVITYARRYALAALVGVAPDEDDDANAAEQPRHEAREVQPDPETGEVPMEAPKASGPDPVINWGSNKGQRASELSDRDLSYHIQREEKKVAEGNRYADKSLLGALKAVKAKRASQDEAH